MFKLLDDWRIVLWNAWSSWLMGASFLLDVISVFLQAAGTTNPWLSAGSAVVTVLAMWARLLQQRNMDRKRADFAASTSADSISNQ